MRQTVALLIESSRAYGRGLLHGIARYVRTDARWSVLHHERGLGDAAPDWLKHGECDGVIARIESRQMLAALRRLGKPTVDLRGRHPATGIACIGTDDRAVARLAARHLLVRGFRHFAFCGFAGADYSDQRRDHFRACIRETGRDAAVFESGGPPTGADTSDIEAGAMLGQLELGRWIASRPKPVGLMACNDARGRQVLGACREHDIDVPNHVAVIGVDNDEVICDLSNPPLSSVVPATQAIGFQAAALLDRMMAGEPPPADPVLVEPTGIVTRLSTEVLAVEDPQVAAAARFIRERALDGINVEDVLDHLAAAGPAVVSRSTLDRHFTQVLGHSPKDEILRVRIERVRQLLAGTEYSLAQVAAMTGIEHAEQLSAIFKRETGETPSAFRRRMAGTG